FDPKSTRLEFSSHRSFHGDLSLLFHSVVVITQEGGTVKSMDNAEKESASSTLEKAQTRANFLIFITIFLSLILKSGLDNVLKFYDEVFASSAQVCEFWLQARAHDYYFLRLVYLATLIVIVIQSFELLLNVNSNQTYSQMLSKGPRDPVRALFGGMIFVLAFIYFLA